MRFIHLLVRMKPLNITHMFRLVIIRPCIVIDYLNYRFDVISMSSLSVPYIHTVVHYMGQLRSTVTDLSERNRFQLFLPSAISSPENVCYFPRLSTNASTRYVWPSPGPAVSEPRALDSL